MPFDAQNTHLKPFAAFVCTDIGAAVAKEVMVGCGGSDQTVHGGGLSGAARLSPDTFSDRTVLAEMGKIPLSMACECVSELRSFGVDTIVLGEPGDLATYRALKQAGALDYFPFPVTADEILAAGAAPAAAPVAEAAAPAKIAKGRSVGVVGCKGGVGASLLAQNLAVHASAATGASLRTALLDADLEFGSQAIDLDRDGTAGLFEALSAPDRVDSTFISATMEHLHERLSLYSGQVRAGQDAHGFEPSLAALLPRLTDEFEAVVTDIPRGTLLRHPEIASAFDNLVLVLPAGYSGVGAANRLIEHLINALPDLSIQLVLSDLRKDAGLSDKDVTYSLERPLTTHLPRCDAALAKAHRAAKPLLEVQRRSPWSKAVAKIWDAAQTSDPAEAPKKKRRKGLFG